MTGALTTRIAHPTECAALEDLMRRASLAAPDYREQLLANPDAIHLPQAQVNSGSVIVVERDGAVIGFAAVIPRDDGQADLDGLFVEPDHQRKGAGKYLVRAAAEFARALDAGHLHVIANPAELAFYKSCGFIVTGEAQTRFAVAPVMTLALP